MYVLRGAAYQEEGVTDKSIVDFTQAIGLLEKHASHDVIAQAYVARASAYILKDDFHSALEDYRAARELNPADTQILERFTI